jgi:two-component system, response regulator YesN
MKVLIADDDIQIRTGIKEGIDWGDIGVDEVFLAADGLEAFDVFQRFSPDIVITDIRMPGMDGLELSAKIVEQSQVTKIIILSAYQEFEYAKKALQLGVMDYELKPIKLANLISLVNKAKQDVYKELENEKKVAEYNETYKSKFLEECLFGVAGDSNIIKDNMLKYYNFDVNGTLACFTVIIDNYSIISSNMSEYEKKSLHGEILNFITEWLGSKNGLLYDKSPDTYIVLYKPFKNKILNNSDKFDLQKFFDDLNNAINSKYKVTLSMGISNYGDKTNINGLYEKSISALEFKFYKGIKSLIFYSEVSPKFNNTWHHTKKEKEIKESILNLDFESIGVIINDEFNKIRNEQCYYLENIKSICIDYLNILIRSISELSIDFDELFNNKIKNFNDIGNYSTLDDYKVWVLDNFKLVLDDVSDVLKVKHNYIILKAMEYIKKNYYKDIIVEDMADYVERTPNYLSHLFKKETNITLSEYINLIRIKEAKNLIKNSNHLSYEIAQKVGFADYKYFTKVFKKIAGCAPSEYKKG